MVKADGKTERMKVYIFFKFSSLASIFAGGLSCGLYTTNSPATTKYICQQAPLDFLVLQNIQMMEEMLENEPEIDKIVKKFILMDPHDCISTRFSKNIVSWQDVKESSYEVNDEVLNEIERKQAVNKVCMLQFTSGTTGPPKGINLEFYSTYVLKLN